MSVYYITEYTCYDIDYDNCDGGCVCPGQSELSHTLRVYSQFIKSADGFFFLMFALAMNNIISM